MAEPQVDATGSLNNSSEQNHLQRTDTNSGLLQKEGNEELVLY